MTKLKGLVVLLTGASRGLGPLVAEAVGRRGATLALTARSAASLEATAGRLREIGVEVSTFPADLCAQAEREELVAGVLRTCGRIDALVNNAGTESEGAFADLPWPSVAENLETNLLAPMALTHLVLPGMLERGSGHIVNVASIAAKSGAPYAAAYSGAKAGLAEWARALRLELRGTGVRFSTIFPGYVREVGMFARFGMTPPFLVGTCSPRQVAEAVVEAMEKGRTERIVNGRPLRYAFALSELSPSVGDWLMRFSGVVDFQRRKVGK